MAEPQKRNETYYIDETMLGTNPGVVVFDHSLAMGLEDPIYKEVNEGEDSEDTTHQCDFKNHLTFSNT